MVMAELPDDTQTCKPDGTHLPLSSGRQTYPAFLQEHGPCNMSCCNGFISMHPYKAKSKTFVYNPNTKQILSIPLNTDAFKDYASVRNFIAFEPISKQYKLMILGTWHESATSTHCEIITLGTNDWRRVVIDGTPSISDAYSTRLNGALHWLTFDGQRLVVFDLKSEKLRTILCPKSRVQEGQRVGFEICQIRGRLSLMERGRYRPEASVDVWTLKDDNNGVWVRESIKLSMLQDLLSTEDTESHLHVVGGGASDEILISFVSHDTKAILQKHGILLSVHKFPRALVPVSPGNSRSSTQIVNHDVKANLEKDEMLSSVHKFPRLSVPVSPGDSRFITQIVNHDVKANIENDEMLSSEHKFPRVSVPVSPTTGDSRFITQIVNHDVKANIEKDEMLSSVHKFPRVSVSVSPTTGDSRSSTQRDPVSQPLPSTCTLSLTPRFRVLPTFSVIGISNTPVTIRTIYTGFGLAGISGVDILDLGSRVFSLSSEDQGVWSHLMASNWKALRPWFFSFSDCARRVLFGGRLLWVDIIGLPIVCWNHDSISDIVGNLGMLITVHPCTLAPSQSSRALALVHVLDVTAGRRLVAANGPGFYADVLLEPALPDTIPYVP